MEEKKAKKKDGGGLYIAICCCILVIALIGYANNLSQKNKEEEEFFSEQTGENTITPEIPENEVETAPPVSEPEPINEAPPLEKETEATAKNETAKETPVFIPPVSGKVLAEFTDKQIYYERIEEWRTHNGIDMECAIGDSVSAAMDGNVSKVFMGSLGYSVQIDHEGGASTIYSNLDENPTVALGDSVKQGDVIGHIGQSAVGDMTEAPHLHFEIKVNGEYKNPLQYIGLQ